MPGKGLPRLRHWVSSPTYRSTIEVIVAARHEVGLSQKAVADRLGKPPSFIAKVELGERRLDLVEFIAIGRALGMDPAQLFGRIVAAAPDKLEF